MSPEHTDGHGDFGPENTAERLPPETATGIGRALDALITYEVALVLTQPHLFFPPDDVICELPTMDRRLEVQVRAEWNRYVHAIATAGDIQYTTANRTHRDSSAHLTFRKKDLRNTLTWKTDSLTINGWLSDVNIQRTNDGYSFIPRRSSVSEQGLRALDRAISIMFGIEQEDPFTEEARWARTRVSRENYGKLVTALIQSNPDMVISQFDPTDMLIVPDRRFSSSGEIKRWTDMAGNLMGRSMHVGPYDMERRHGFYRFGASLPGIVKRYLLHDNDTTSESDDSGELIVTEYPVMVSGGGQRGELGGVILKIFEDQSGIQAVRFGSAHQDLIGIASFNELF